MRTMEPLDHPPSEIMLGQLLDDRYRIVGVLGRGGIGIVYRAQQRHVHDRDVAVKILNAGASARASTATRFENEARIIAQLRHPNTLKLIDTGRTADGRLYIVTECLRGVPLSEKLEAGPLGQSETVRIVGQIAEALIEAHEVGVVHRDLKPANVFLEEVGSQQVVKVLDFGIAKLVSAAALTAPMQIFGTPGFMAPEQCLGQAVDGRTDLFALGVIAYVCLTLEMPVEGESVEDLLAATIETPPTLLREHLPSVDPELEGLVMQLLAKDPGDRLPDAVAVRDACARLLRLLASTDPVALPNARAQAPEILPAWSEDDLEEETASSARPPADARYDRTPESPLDLEAPTPEDDAAATQISPPALPDDTRILDPAEGLRTTVPAGARPDDSLDHAPTVRPGSQLEAPNDTADTRAGTQLSPRETSVVGEPSGLGRNIALALASAAVAAALATAALLAFGS